MPRAKRPIPYESHYTVKQVTLDPETQEYLAKRLGIWNHKDRVKAMVADVEEVLTEHQGWIEDLDKSPSPASRIISLESIQKSALDLLDSIRELDVYTRQTLYFHLSSASNAVAATPKDPEGEFKADLEALNKIIQRSQNARKSLLPYKKQGRRKNSGLRWTMLKLALIFFEYDSGKIEKRRRHCMLTFNEPAEQRRRHFISRVLEIAQIDHPDPDVEPKRFDSLLNPPHKSTRQ